MSGEGVPWMPVHVITSDSVLFDQLLAKAIPARALPARPTLSKTNELLPDFALGIRELSVVFGHGCSPSPRSLQPIAARRCLCF